MVNDLGKFGVWCHKQIEEDVDKHFHIRAQAVASNDIVIRRGQSVHR